MSARIHIEAEPAANEASQATSDGRAFGASPFRLEGDALVVQIPGTGVEPRWLAAGSLEELGWPAEASVRSARVEASPGWRWSTGDAAFLAQVLQHLDSVHPRVAIRGLPDELQNLLALARAGVRAAPATPATPDRLIARIGGVVLQRVLGVRHFLGLFGQVVLLLTWRAATRVRVRGKEMLEALAECSISALLIVAVVNLLMGAILAFVGAVQLRPFGAGIYVANLVGIASVRELTPILTAIVLAGRTGASFAARIATMQGNEEVDALTTLGISPVEFLVLPRVVALSLLMPLLCVYGAVMALLGGLAVAVPFLDLSVTTYLTQTQQAIGGAHFAMGGLKAFVFGALVALLGCHFGLQAERSAAGVGAATTDAVVTAIVGIIVLDAVFAVCANALQI
jgi:phospholipid/cholesterol/gamma-HCH transport system permease protein